MSSQANQSSTYDCLISQVFLNGIGATTKQETQTRFIPNDKSQMQYYPTGLRALKAPQCNSLHLEFGG